MYVAAEKIWTSFAILLRWRILMRPLKIASKSLLKEEKPN
jgi:hypothetical protein